MDVTLLYFDDCPNWRDVEARLEELQAEFRDLRVVRHLVDTVEEAERVGFVGSPSILIDGRDAFDPWGSTGSLSCRRYQTPGGFAGSPTLDQLRAALQRACDQ